MRGVARPDGAVGRGWAAMYVDADEAGDSGTADPLAGPSAGLYLTEPARGLANLAVLPLAAPWLAAAPRGDGHGVLVVPGLLASDMSTALLRRFVPLLGHDRRGLGPRRELGPAPPLPGPLPAGLAAP